MGKATVGAQWVEVAAGKEMERSVSSGASAGSGNSKNSSNVLHKFPAWNSSPTLIFTRDSIFNCVAPLAFKKCICWTKEKIVFIRSSWPARPKVRQFASILTFLFFVPKGTGLGLWLGTKFSEPVTIQSVAFSFEVWINLSSGESRALSQIPLFWAVLTVVAM